MKVFIIGAGGHAEVIADSLLKSGQQNLSFVDRKPNSQKVFGQFEVLAEDLFWAQCKENNKDKKLIVAIGDNFVREEIVKRYESLSLNFANSIHPSTSISQFAKLGHGVVIMPMASIGPNSVIGHHTIINTGALVDHDCLIESFASLGPGCVLGGGVTVGHGSVLGIGAVVRHGVKIGKNVVIGAGANVTKDIPDNVVAYGNPCRVMKPRSPGEKYL